MLELAGACYTDAVSWTGRSLSTSLSTSPGVASGFTLGGTGSLS